MASVPPADRRKPLALVTVALAAFPPSTPRKLPLHDSPAVPVATATDPARTS